MRLALIYSDYTHKSFEEDVGVVSEQFGTFPPLGLCYAAAIAEKAGHETLVVDAHAQRLTPQQVLERIRPFDPQILGFLLTTYMIHDNLSYIRFLKAETGLPVVVGNVQLELYPHETMSYPEIDYGIIGSAQPVLPALLDALERGGPVPELPGLCLRRNGELIVNQPATLCEDFATLPFPKRDGLPHELYHSVMTRRHNVTAMITAKGCPGGCTFCHIHRTPYSYRDPQGVCDEIEQCIERHSIREFEIFDPSFTINRERIVQICDEIVRRGLDLDFAVRARVDQVDPGLLAKMAAAGCQRLLYGIESGSEQQLARVQKGISLKQVRDTVSATRDAGIEALGFFLIGSQDETLDEVAQTVRFARSLGLDYAQFHRTMPKPRTVLHEIVTEQLGFDYWREYTLGNQPERRLPSPWTELSQEQIEHETFRAYRRFYVRPSFVMRKLLGIRSLDEFARYARGGLGLLLAKSDLQ
ncbi:MAG: radical SAM protein [Candidatus Alcyoniella australis]|nr:radical SAM protein [Candidatus Alcyoniella australis]